MNSQMHRRTFIRTMGGAAVIVLSPVTQMLRMPNAFAADETNAFRFIHDDSISIVLDFAKKADRYDVTVRRGAEELESFANVRPFQLHRLKTEHFSVVYFDVTEDI